MGGRGGGIAFGHLLGEDAGEADNGCGGLGETIGIGGIRFCRLMDERAIGGAGGDVDERVRAVGGIDEVTLQHDVGDVSAQGDVVRGERAQDGLEIVDQLGDGCVFEGGAEAGGVEGDFDGGGAVDGEAKADGGVGECGELHPTHRDQAAMDGAPDVLAGAANMNIVSGGSGSGSASESDSEEISSEIARASSMIAIAKPNAAVSCSLFPVPCSCPASVVLARRRGARRVRRGWV